MADYKFVDADQLDSDLSGIANAIRKKGGTSASMSFPNGFSSAINAISTGATVKRYPASGLGSFTTNSSGAATVNCGFQPDIVYIQGIQQHDDYHGQTNSASAAIAFAVENRENPLSAMPAAEGVYQMLWTKTNNGFAIEILKFGFDWNATVPRETFSFVAIKYTA